MGIGYRNDVLHWFVCGELYKKDGGRLGKMAPVAGVYARISCHLPEPPMAIKQVKSVADSPSEELGYRGVRFQ